MCITKSAPASSASNSSLSTMQRRRMTQIFSLLHILNTELPTRRASQDTVHYCSFLQFGRQWKEGVEWTLTPAFIPIILTEVLWLLASFREMTRNKAKWWNGEMLYTTALAMMLIMHQRDGPLSEILSSSRSRVSFRPSLSSYRAPLMPLYIKYGRASVFGISTVLTGKWRDLHSCRDGRRNDLQPS